MLKNITLSAEKSLIDKARVKARKEHTTLNERFRQWLKSYAQDTRTKSDYLQFMEKEILVKPGRKFSREEINEW